MQYNRSMRTLLLVLLITAWGLFVVVRTLRLTLPPITDFELRRRLDRRDPSGQRLATRREQLPYVLALRLLLSLATAIALTAISLQLWSGWGLFITLGLIYGGEIISGWPLLVRLIEKIYRRYEIRILRSTLWLRYVLAPIVDSAQDEQPSFFSLEELEDMIKRDTTVLTPDQKKLLAHMLIYPTIKVRDVMTAQQSMVTVEANETLSPITLDTLHKSGHSSFPVMDSGGIAGLLHIRELSLDPRRVVMRDAMDRRVGYVNQDETLDHALRAFLRMRQHLCIVVNNQAEVVGLVTIQDVVERLLDQKLADEFDAYDDRQAIADLSTKARQNSTEVV